VTTGDQPQGKGIIAAVIAAVAAILVAVFGNFQNIFKGDDAVTNRPSLTTSQTDSQATMRPEIKVEGGSVVIAGSFAGRDITVNADKEQQK
jgi:hypothetical protein